MGIGITDVTPENSKFFDMTDASGAVVTQVESGFTGRKGWLEGRRRDHRAEWQES